MEIWPHGDHKKLLIGLADRRVFKRYQSILKMTTLAVRVETPLWHQLRPTPVFYNISDKFYFQRQNKTFGDCAMNNHNVTAHMMRSFFQGVPLTHLILPEWTTDLLSNQLQLSTCFPSYNIPVFADANKTKQWFFTLKVCIYE